jgi:hypothetical protein
MGFIKSRLNKDNFWNLMFLVATASGIMLSEWLMAIPEVSLVGLLTLITSLTFVPWLMISLNSVSWVGGKAFVSKQGRLINTKPLKWLLLVFPAIAGSIVVVPDFLEILFSSDALDRFIITLVFTSFLIAPVLFFILINCPISILFNRNSYRPSVNGMKFQQSHFGNHKPLSPTASPTLWEKTISPRRDYYSFNKDEHYYSYAYRHLGSNIHRNR